MKHDTESATMPTENTHPTATGPTSPEQEEHVSQAEGPGSVTLERTSLITRAREGLDRFRIGLQEGLPFPLVIQGALESIQVYILGVLVVAVPLAVAAIVGGWSDATAGDVAHSTGQWWLLGHGVPLTRSADASGGAGTMWFLPLGFVLLPGWLAWRAGRRLARASWSDQLWQAILGAVIIYAVGGLATTLWASTSVISAAWWAAAVIPPVIHLVGLIGGAWREAGSFGRLIGFDAAEWVVRHSQYQRWAGSYVWAVLRAGCVGLLGAVGLAAVAFTVQLVVSWVDVLNNVFRLNPGAWGGATLMLLQLAFVPNLVVYTLAYLSGAGFSLGETISVSPFGSFGTDLPPLPLVGMIPESAQPWILVIPVVAGIVGGWWFLREGENHLEEWLLLSLNQRWLALTASTVILGLAIAACSAAGFLMIGAMSSGTLGMGVFTGLGPHLWASAGLLGAEIGIGAMIGNLAAPLFERDPVLDA